jgi:hypothetical protein
MIILGLYRVDARKAIRRDGPSALRRANWARNGYLVRRRWVQEPSDDDEVSIPLHRVRLMTETPDIGPIKVRRRGVPPGRVLLWMFVAACAGAIGWGVFGNTIRAALNLPPQGAADWMMVSTPVNQGATAGEFLGLLKDLQASQQRTSDDVRTAVRLLTAEQDTTKALSEAVAVLQSKVDALQQRPVAPVPVPVVRKSSGPPPARRPAPPRQITPSPEPDQAEPEAEGAAR